jgi:hypothetical protein
MAGAAGLGACGGAGTQQDIVARVGHLAIPKAALTNWMAMEAHGRRRALESLIETEWLIGEASDLGTQTPEGEVDGQLGVADRKLEAAGRLAATKIRIHLEAATPKVTWAEIGQYYKRHVKQFVRRELREFYIEEDLTNEEEAVRRRGELERGTASISTSGTHLYESLTRPVNLRSAGRMEQVIFSGKPRAILGPVLGDSVYYLMQVTRVVPAHVETLADERQAIKDELETAHWQQTLARFITAWRRKWTAKTDCSAGYIVQRCRQFRGAEAPEDAAPFA